MLFRINRHAPHFLKTYRVREFNTKNPGKLDRKSNPRKEEEAMLNEAKGNNKKKIATVVYNYYLKKKNNSLIIQL